MNSVNRYLKIAKDTVIKPAEDMDKKIIDRISHIKESDKKLLDEKFIDYFKKSNSRVYLMLERIKNNPGAFAILVIAVISIIIAITIMAKKSLSKDETGEENNQSSSSKNDT